MAQSSNNKLSSMNKSLREWYPLESSPEVFTQMARSWGLPEKYSFVDVLGLDDELLSLVPRPVHAIILLAPDTTAIVEMRKSEGPYLSAHKGSPVIWIPQVNVGHSCGTFALIHALGTTRLAPKLDDFFNACRDVEAAERTQLFASSPLIYDAHHGAITAGQTEIRESDWEDCDHFLSFAYAPVQGQTRLVELDGNAPRDGPLDRGPSKGDLLKDVAEVVRELYLPKAGDSVNFSMIALVG